MKEVDAIKNIEQIEQVKKMLLKHYGMLYQDIFTVGVNVALRISDLLSLTFSNIDWKKGEIIIKEMKTDKIRKIALNKSALDILNKRKEQYSNDKFIFTSHSNRSSGDKPLSRSIVSKVFKEIGEMDNISIHLGTHSLRKTRGFHLYKNGTPIETICKMLNHSSTAITLRYIGITPQYIDKTYS